MSGTPVLDIFLEYRSPHPSASPSGRGRHLSPVVDQAGSPVLPHRRISPGGRPTEEDIAAQIRAERTEPEPGILAVERKGTADVIGYCGLIFHGDGSPGEPSLPTSCCARLAAAVTQRRQAGPWSHGCGKRVTGGCGAGVRALECRVATGPGEARVPGNGTGGARRCARRQPADRTRVLNGARSSPPHSPYDQAGCCCLTRTGVAQRCSWRTRRSRLSAFLPAPEGGDEEGWRGTHGSCRGFGIVSSSGSTCSRIPV